MFLRHCSFLILSLAALPLLAVEVEPAKLATADAAPVDPGSLEVALSGGVTTASRVFGDDSDRGGRLREVGLGLGLTYGVAENLDAAVGLGVTRVDDTASVPDHGQGLTDLELGAKWAFAAWEAGEDRNVALALLPAVILPLGRNHDDEESLPTASRAFAAGLAVAASGQVEAWSLNADVGQTRFIGSEEDRGGTTGTTAADAAVGYRISETLQPEVNLSWARDQVDEGEAPWAMTVTVGSQVFVGDYRLGLGVQQIVAASDGSARATTVGVDVVTVFP